MIALDTNVLVRYLVEDDREQGRRAAVVIDRAIAADEPLFVSSIVLCELAWVLRGSYRQSRRQVGTTLRALLQARQLIIDAPDLVARALDTFERSRGDFADYLIREQARAAGHDTVVTFDQALHKDPGFRAP